MAEYLTSDTELASVADAIRAKGGTSAQLEFPTGFVNAIASIPSGGGGEEVTITVQGGSELFYVDTDGVYQRMSGHIDITDNVFSGALVFCLYNSNEPGVTPPSVSNLTLQLTVSLGARATYQYAYIYTAEAT